MAKKNTIDARLDRAINAIHNDDRKVVIQKITPAQEKIAKKALADFNKAAKSAQKKSK